MKTICLSISLLFIFFISCHNKPTSSFSTTVVTDNQPDVLSRQAIDSILDGFEQRPYVQLGDEYHNYSDPGLQFKPALKSRNYFVLHKEDLSKKMVGKFRVRDFVTHDEYYRSSFTDSIFWLVDRKVLYMLLELIQETDKLGHDMYAFRIYNGHRHPRKNKEVKGAKRSQHILGCAIDIEVKDVNRDGRATQSDKKILHTLLEEIVDDRGGIGRYPGSMSLHFDCRGRKARWDSY